VPGPLDLNTKERGVRGLFAKEFLTQRREVLHTKFCQIVDSDKEEEKYNFIGTVPQLQKLTDERVIAGLSEYEYTLKNEIYVSGLSIPRKVIEDDQTGQLRTLVSSLAARVANFPDELVFELIKNGATAGYTAYDGVVYFATTHSLDGGVTAQSNLLTGNLYDDDLPSSGATDSDKFVKAVNYFRMDFARAKSALLALKDDRGKPWHQTARPEALIILCGPDMEYIVRTAMEGVIISQTTNVMVQSVASIEVTPYDINNSTALKGSWYLMKLDTPVKPFIFQRWHPKMSFQDEIPGIDNDIVNALASVEIQTVFRSGQNISFFTFKTDEYLMGARTRYSAGYGMWQNCLRIAGAGATRP